MKIIPRKLTYAERRSKFRRYLKLKWKAIRDENNTKKNNDQRNVE